MGLLVGGRGNGERAKERVIVNVTENVKEALKKG